MEVGVRALRNNTSEVIAAVESGERVTLTVRGNPVADIRPPRAARPLALGRAARELETRAADPGLSGELATLAGQTLDEL